MILSGKYVLKVIAYVIKASLRDTKLIYLNYSNVKANYRSLLRWFLKSDSHFPKKFYLLK